MFGREKRIEKLKRKLELLNEYLVSTYRHDMVLEWQEIQREVEIQTAYLELENTYL